MTHALPKTKEEMKIYRQSALPLEDSCLVAYVYPDKEVTNQRSAIKQAEKILPIVWIDIQKMPELSDLGRVHQFEGEGEATFTWIYLQEQKAESIFFLDVQLQKPVKTAFHIPFRVREWWLLLEMIAQHGDIWFVPGPALDWRPMLQEMGHEAFMKVIEETCGSGVTLTLDQGTMQELNKHIHVWKARFPLLVSSRRKK